MKLFSCRLFQDASTHFVPLETTYIWSCARNDIEQNDGGEGLQIAGLCGCPVKERTKTYVTATGVCRRAQDAPLYGVIFLVGGNPRPARFRWE